MQDEEHGHSGGEGGLEWGQAPKTLSATLIRLVSTDALLVPENPRHRQRGCRMIILRSRHGKKTSVYQLTVVYYLLGAVYRPRRATRIKSYAVICPEGPAFFTQWFSAKAHGIVLTAAGVPGLVADEVEYTHPLLVIAPVEQCGTITEELRRRGKRIESERIFTRGSYKERRYVCLIRTGEKIPETYLRSLI